jgi:hypothetical protein
MYHLGTGSPLPPRFQLAKLVAAPRVGRLGRWFRDFLRMTLQRNPADRADITDVANFLQDSADTLLLFNAEAFAMEEEQLACPK